MFKIVKTYQLYLLLLLLCVANIRAQADVEEQEDEQFAEFAEHMGDFNPTETFEFQLKNTEQETLILWPQLEVESVRGIFYITSENNRGLFMGVEARGGIQKSFYNKKLGVFNVPHMSAGDMKLIFKAEIEPLKIYISYQLVKRKMPEEPTPQQPPASKDQTPESPPNASSQQQPQASDTPQQKPAPTQQTQFDQGYFQEKKELEEVLKKFKKVEIELNGQQIFMKQVTQNQNFQAERLRNEVSNKQWKVILETIFVVGSGLVSLWFIRKEFANRDSGQILI